MLSARAIKLWVYVLTHGEHAREVRFGVKGPWETVFKFEDVKICVFLGKNAKKTHVLASVARTAIVCPADFSGLRVA